MHCPDSIKRGVIEVIIMTARAKVRMKKQRKKVFAENVVVYSEKIALLLLI